MYVARATCSRLKTPKHYHILLPSDVFPPGKVGGAARSAHALAHALLAAGHRVTAIVPQAGQRGVVRGDAEGIDALRYGYTAPRIPFLQNYARHERLWPSLARAIVTVAHETVATPTIIHAQHVQVTPASIIAGQALGVPVVVTVRDHWPWDYFATGLHGDQVPYRSGTHAFASLATDLVGRLGPLKGALAVPAIPYMLAHLRRRAAFLAQADAVIAVSAYIAARLAPLVRPERLHVLPNMVDIERLDRIAATPLQTSLAGPFLLFVGKLERNKGAQLLLAIAQAAQAQGLKLPPLVVAGNGALRETLEAGLHAAGVATQFLAWADYAEVLRLMARCELLLFPSAWGEPLSRVLLEASALGTPILAMPTGGTPDILTDGVSGALAATPAAFAQRLGFLLAHQEERRRLGAGARVHAQTRFTVAAVRPQVEAVYAQVLAAR